MTTVGIVGVGCVGSALATAYRSKGCEVLVHDIVPERSTHGLNEVLQADFVMVCLPTPKKRYNGECDTSHVNQFFTLATSINRNANLVLRSTVPVGYTRGAAAYYGLPNLVHSPEFLTMRTAVEDATNPTRCVVGNPNPKRSGNFFAGDVALFYTEMHPDTLVTICPSDVSETVKLFQNSFSAVKISLLNEFREFCDKRGMEWDTVLDILLGGGWVGESHTQVPGPDGKRGYGGACFPKDIRNLIMCMHEAGVEPVMLKASMERNRRDRPEGE